MDIYCKGYTASSLRINRLYTSLIIHSLPEWNIWLVPQPFKLWTWGSRHTGCPVSCLNMIPGFSCTRHGLSSHHTTHQRNQNNHRATALITLASHSHILVSSFSRRSFSTHHEVWSAWERKYDAAILHVLVHVQYTSAREGTTFILRGIYGSMAHGVFERANHDIRVLGLGYGNG